MKRHMKYHDRGYDIKITDYQYKGRPPIGVSISGTQLGECINPLGEACYFCAFIHAMSMSDGKAMARECVNERVRTRHDAPHGTTR